MLAVFYGVGAAVIGIIAISSYKLTTKSIGSFSMISFKKNALLWLFFIVAATITIITMPENVLLFVAAGAVYMLTKAPPKWSPVTNNTSFFLLQTGFWDYESSTLIKIAIFFTKAGAFVFGSGLAIVPFLHAGVVTENHWLTEQQFLDAVAVAKITPGSRSNYGSLYRLPGGGFSGCMCCSPGYFLTLLFIHSYTCTVF